MKKNIFFFLLGIYGTFAMGQTIPFCDNFDGLNNWKDTSLNIFGTSWQRGIPVTGVPASAHSLPEVWEVGLTSFYQNSSNSYLISPGFNFTNVSNATLSCWLNYNSESGWDGTHIEYSTDSLNWQVLGTTFDPNGVNWYPQQTINCDGLPAWNGLSAIVPGNVNGWFKAEYTLAAVGLNNIPTAWFRFHFCSDASVTAIGFAIDDFCITMPVPNDAGVTSIDQQAFQNPVGSCLPVIVTIKNFGSLPITQMGVFYSLNVGSPVGHSWTGNLAPGSFTTDTLSCYTVPINDYGICAYTTLSGDSSAFNDTTCISGFGIPQYTPTFCHDFENGNDGWYTGTTNFPPSQWEPGTPNFGTTTGAHSGSVAWDINLDSAYTISSLDTLYSPLYNVSGIANATLSFWQNMNITFGASYLLLEYSVNGFGYVTLGTVADPDGIGWYNAYALGIYAWSGNTSGWVNPRYFLHAILATNPNTLQFRFIFNSYGAPVADGVSIDDFCLVNPPPFDAGIATLTSASGSVLQQGQLDSITVSIRNFGSDTLTSCNVYFNINNGSPIGPFTWTGSIPPGQISAPFVLSGFTYVVQQNSYGVCAWTDLVNDADHSNDSLCFSLYGTPVFNLSYLVPFCDSFDGVNYWSPFPPLPTNAGGSEWQRGTPSYGLTNSSHSPPSCWDVNLNYPYQPSANIALYSPVFIVDTASLPVLSFWQNTSTELMWDGIRVEYRTNNPYFWQTLGTFNDPLGTNWYTQQTLNCSQLPGWSGNSNGWTRCEYKTGSMFSGQTVQFRIVFCSDPSVLVDGVSIDDFCFQTPAPLNASANSISLINPFPINFPGQCFSFNSEIKNNGTAPLDSVSVSLIVDGTTVVTDQLNFSTPLVNGAISPVHTFSNCWTSTPGNHTACLVTSFPNGSTDLITSDDTVCISFAVVNDINLTSGNSFCDDFETSADFVPLNAINNSAVSSWEYGNPNKPTVCMVGSYSGTHSWVTKLLQNYPANDQSALWSPPFKLNTNTTYNISFFLKTHSENFTDGGTFQYSTDYGMTWNIFGNFVDPNWFNTFNVIAISPTPPPYSPGWTGYISCTNGWENMHHLICFPAPGGANPVNVLFRFVFMSDVFSGGGGIQMDDFCIAPDTALCTVGMEEFFPINGISLEQNIPNPFSDETLLSYSIPFAGKTQIEISDVTGKIIDIPVDAIQIAGKHQINLKANKFSPGIYFYTLKWKEKTITRKMIMTGR